MDGLTCQCVCNFVWQYESRKKWHTFPDEEIQSLNESLKMDEYYFKVDKKNAKPYVVDMEHMCKVYCASLYEQRVRCLITHPDFQVWLFKKKEDWISFSPGLSYLLEVAYQKKETEVKISAFEFNIETLQGLKIDSEGSKYLFPFKREQVQVNITDEIKEIIKKNKSMFEIACSQELSSTIKLLEACSNNSSDKGRKRKRSPSVDSTEEEEILPVTGISKVNLKVLQKSENKKDSDIAAVDNECPVKDNVHVYVQGSAFSATLNQTSLQNNNNKFYIIQLLELNNKKQYYVWRRWGRVGQKGQTNLNHYTTNLAEALKEFEGKFFDKTKNYWEEKEKFVHVKGKYDLLQINFTPQVEVKMLDIPSKLSVQLQALMTLICDTRRMEEIMKEMCFDSNKTPLGELTLSQVRNGYIALNKIVSILHQGGHHSELINACNDFYTKVPHNFGMKTPPIIKTQADIESKLKLLEALTNIRVAMNVMNSGTDLAEHSLDKYYKTLNCSLDIIEPGCPEYMAIQKCLQETHGPTHNSYTIEIVHIFKCFKPQDTGVIMDNKLVLWHGSRIINWLGILKDGLRIAPPEAPRTGYMFGKGIYFADVCSKSANYCYATKRKSDGLLLMSEVSMGKQHTLLEADEKMPETLPLDYNSVVGKGRISPKDFQTSVLSSDAKIPVGPLVENPGHEGSLHYNEYIVYNVKQVKMKYLIWIKFNFL